MRGKELLRKAQLYLLLALGTYPACACIVVFIAPELLDYLWLLSAAFWALGCLSLVLPQKLRLGVGIVGALILTVPGALLLQGNARNILLVFGVGHGALLLWSLQIAGWDVGQELAPGWLGGGVTVLLIGCLLSYYEPRLETVSLGIRISLFVFAFFAMRSLNRGSLQLASGGKGSISRMMRRKNLLLTMGMFALAVLVALIPSLFHLVKALFAWIGELMARISALFPASAQAETTVPSTTEETVIGEGMEVLTEGLQTHRTTKTTFVMMAVIALGIMVPVGGFALYKLCVVLWGAVQRFARGILEGASTVTEDFEDEVTDTRMEDPEHYREGKTGEKRPALGKQTPAEKIRYRYKRLQRKHPQWGQSSTARENLRSDAASLYEKARYSSHPITAQDAEDFKNKTK